jgi:AraC-like DNA-binding protein
MLSTIERRRAKVKPQGDGSQVGELGARAAQSVPQVRLAEAKHSHQFDEVFRATLDQIIQDAKASGLSMQRLAKLAGISRAQFSRWRTTLPLTVQTITKLQIQVRLSTHSRPPASA